MTSSKDTTEEGGEKKDATKEGLSWLAIASSKTFRFLVGSEKSEFTISSALVAHQSPALQTLIHGQFCDARNGYVTLDWVDEDTFTRFIQYAYTGDYDAASNPAVINALECRPKHATNLKRKRPATETQPPGPSKVKRVNTVGGNCRTETEFVYKVIRKNMQFHGRDGLWARFTQATNRFKQRRFTLGTMKPEEDHSQVFLCHAKMHVFADYYGILDLMDLSQNKLGEVLITLGDKFGGERVADFVTLMRYCYEEPAPEEFRSYVMIYAANHARTLWEDAGFQDLAKENSEVCLGLIKELISTEDHRIKPQVREAIPQEETPIHQPATFY